MARREAQARSVPPSEDASAHGPRHLATAGGTAGSRGPAGSALERAERALADRVKAFTEASEALRAEIAAFSQAVAEAQERPAERELRLVVNRDTGEVEAVARTEQEDDEPPTPEQIAQFFRTHEGPRDPEDAIPTAPSVPLSYRPRNLARERLYADIGGTIIGLGGAVALIDFVLLR